MSAFVVPYAHITVLAVFIKQRGIRPAMTVQEIGEKLYSENVKSIRYRYPDDDEDYGKFAIDERAAFIRPSLVQIIKAANCLDYQSCEHPSYRQSEVCRMLDAVTALALKELPVRVNGHAWNEKNIYDHPEYDKAAWS